MALGPGQADEPAQDRAPGAGMLGLSRCETYTNISPNLQRGQSYARTMPYLFLLIYGCFVKDPILKTRTVIEALENHTR